MRQDLEKKMAKVPPVQPPTTEQPPMQIIHVRDEEVKHADFSERASPRTTIATARKRTIPTKQALPEAHLIEPK